MQEETSANQSLTEASSYTEANSGTKDPKKSLRIAENLFIALQHLRFLHDPRVLWIDAICINQEDLEERSTEVLEMGSIYKNARQVIVWLGPSSNNGNLALETLRRIGESAKYSRERKSIRAARGSWPAALKNDTEALKSHADRWFAVKDILTREWFSRLWVFQEIALAQEASIMVGENCVNWKIAVNGLYWIWSKSVQLDRVINALEMGTIFSSNIYRFMRRGCRAGAGYLTHTLEQTENLLCSDPRDRLYAI